MIANFKLICFTFLKSLKKKFHFQFTFHFRIIFSSIPVVLVLYNKLYIIKMYKVFAKKKKLLIKNNENFFIKNNFCKENSIKICHLLLDTVTRLHYYCTYLYLPPSLYILQQCIIILIYQPHTFHNTILALILFSHTDSLSSS